MASFFLQVSLHPLRYWLYGMPLLLLAALLASCAARPSPDGAPPLQMRLAADPKTPSLMQHRRMEIRATLINSADRFINLHFPTSQRIELELFSPENHGIYRWSDDRRIEPIAGNLAINPGEKAVFDLMVPTRGMRPGWSHTLHVFLPGHESVAASLDIVPLP